MPRVTETVMAVMGLAVETQCTIAMEVIVQKAAIVSIIVMEAIATELEIAHTIAMVHTAIDLAVAYITVMALIVTKSVTRTTIVTEHIQP